MPAGRGREPARPLPDPPPADEALALIRRGASEIIGEDEVAVALGEGRRLRVKAGFDPTSPDIHLGHIVLLQKMRQFQRLGHQVIFLIGDFTALIGDPSGQDRTRPTLDRETIEANAATFAAQAFKVLDPALTEVRRNSEWFGPMPAADLVRLSARSTVARMLERDDFSRRHAARQPISIHEFLYPLLQGYDSTMLEADVELGGTDQKFNLLVGRELQRAQGQRPQAVLTMPLLEGTDGTRKMSKSLGNHIGIDEPAEQIYGKVMSVSDGLMWRYYELLSERTQGEIAAMRAEGRNPMDAKKVLAGEMAARFAGGPEAAERAARDFTRRFTERKAPEEMPVAEVDAGEDGEVLLAFALKSAGLAKSTAEARRKIAQGGVRIDGEKILDGNWRLQRGKEHAAQVGKRHHARISVR